MTVFQACCFAADKPLPRLSHYLPASHLHEHGAGSARVGTLRCCCTPIAPPPPSCTPRLHASTTGNFPPNLFFHLVTNTVSMPMPCTISCLFVVEHAYSSAAAAAAVITTLQNAISLLHDSASFHAALTQRLHFARRLVSSRFHELYRRRCRRRRRYAVCRATRYYLRMPPQRCRPHIMCRFIYFALYLPGCE